MQAAADDTMPVPADSSVVVAMEDFEDFVRTHLPSLLRTAYLLTGGDGPAAEDAVQETLTRLYPRWAQGATGRPSTGLRAAQPDQHLSEQRPVDVGA